MKNSILLTGLALYTATASAQCFKEGYVDTGFGSQEFATAVTKWSTDKFYNEDDNFFISRIKPKTRFRNAATQVREEINETNDKKLVAWVPINNPLVNALPDGKFDSEVFNMWSYVTHYGDWTAALGRVPAAFLDVCHKNGVATSGVASIPWGTIGGSWSSALYKISRLDVQQTADFLRYYGNDGLGYNSEFSGGNDFLRQLRDLHAGIVKASKDNPVFENIWYDGTNDRGGIFFDNGLGGHNIQNFGDGENRRTSLFFNYNWNRTALLQKSITTAEKNGRSPLDLYAGVNMQGGEPAGQSWTLLKDYPISIGLWGAHQQNMFWESRNEQGSTDDTKLRTYMLRTERWFTGGTRNPANCPDFINSLSYSLPNTHFHGMSAMMSARSALKWDLSTEPFITYFNLGNGKFFNWKGVRQHDKEWYNIGVQDYLPTWRYWFSSKLLGRQPLDVPTKGLDAEFVWDDAYMGGSSLRVFGSATEEYLHLFKTEYRLQAGDVITLRYKLLSGSGDMSLVLTAKGAEGTALNESGMKLLAATDEADEDVWVEKTFTVGEELAGKDLALVALHFQNAQNLNLYLGEFSVVRGTAATPAKPEIVSTRTLSYTNQGVDGKIIFNMPNDKPAGTPCYNLDVKTSLFKLYAQQEGCEKVLMGVTTSWAGLLYNAPVDFKQSSKKIRFGVAAVSLDLKSDSEIAWGEYQDPVNYVYNDDIRSSKATIKPGEAFDLYYVDGNHEEGTWSLVNSAGTEVYQGRGNRVSVDGVQEVGSYTLKLTGKVNAYDSNHNLIGRTEETRVFPDFIQITPESIGALPEIQTLTANGQEADIQVEKNTAVDLAYTGRAANGALSRGVNLSEKGFGFPAQPAGLKFSQSAFTCTFWLKFNVVADGDIQIFDVRDQGTRWPQNNWGAIWSTYNKSTKLLGFTIRGNNNLEHTNFWKIDFVPGVWMHFAIAMEKTNQGIREHLYVNGNPAKCVKYKNGNQEDTGYNPYYSAPNEWWSNSTVLIGQGRHQCAAMDAVVDDVKFFETELKADQIKEAMNKNEIMPGQTAYYSFENEVNAQTHGFKNEAPKVFSGGILQMNRDSGEGQGSFSFIDPVFDAGSPFISGNKYQVSTTPSWKAKKGVITEAQGNDQTGSAKVTYAKDGVYEVKLTLENSYGSDSKTFKTITVGAGEQTGIEDATLEGTEVTVENGRALVHFASAGNYKVRVYNAAGQLIASKAQFMTEGQHAQIALGHAGVYVLQIEKDGQTLANLKLLNK